MQGRNKFIRKCPMLYGVVMRINRLLSQARELGGSAEGSATLTSNWAALVPPDLEISYPSVTVCNAPSHILQPGTICGHHYSLVVHSDPAMAIEGISNFDGNLPAVVKLPQSIR